jgi:hypothetical protein
MPKLARFVCSPLLLSVFVLGCGASAPVKPPTAGPVAVVTVPEKGATAGSTPTAAPTEAAREGVPRELADMPARGEVVATLRWRDPRATIATIASEVGLPSEVVDVAVRAFLKGAMRETVKDLVDEEAFASVIELSAPFDSVISVDLDADDAKEATVTSLGLTSMPRALAALKHKATQTPSGYWAIGSGDSTLPVACGLFEAVGRAPVRLICGKRTDELEAVGPYLATTLARRELGGGDVHTEVRLRGVLDRVGPKFALQAKALPVLAAGEKIGIPAFDDALMEAAAALGDEVGNLAADLDSVDVDLTFDRTAGVRVEGRLQFAGAHSWLVQRIVDLPPGGPRVPEIFLQTPATASTAGYATGGDPAAFDGVFRVLRGLTEGKLEHVGFGTPADRKAIAALLRVQGAKYVGSMTATGSFDGPLSLSSLQDAVGSFVGYQVTGVEDSPASTVAWLNELVKVYNRPAVRKWFEDTLGDEAKYLPTVKLVPAPKVLGAGALDLELRVSNFEDPMPLVAGLTGSKTAAPSKAGAPATTSLELHVLVVPDGKRTFIGFAADRDKLAKVLVGMKGKTAGPGSIVSVPELAAVRTEPHRAVSYVTLKGMLGGLTALRPLAKLAPADVVGPIERLLVALEQLPRGGKTPMTVITDVVPGPRPRVSFSGTIARGTLDDLGHLGRTVFAEIQKAKASSPAPESTEEGGAEATPQP